MCSSSKPNSFFVPQAYALCFPPFGPWFTGFLCHGHKWCSSVKVQPKHLHLWKATFNSSSCSPHIHQHPKVGVTSPSQQLRCVRDHFLLYRIFAPNWPDCCSVPWGCFSCYCFCLQECSARLAHILLPSSIQVSARLPPPTSPHLMQGLLLPTYALLTLLVFLHST